MVEHTHKASRQLAYWILDVAIDGRIDPGAVIEELIREVKARHAIAQRESDDYSDDELDFWGLALDGACRWHDRAQGLLFASATAAPVEVLQ